MNYRFNEAIWSGKEGEGKRPKLIKKFVIRLPEGYREKIAEISRRNRRSMNSEIVMLLEKYLAEHFPMDQPAAEIGDDVTTNIGCNYQDTSERRPED